MSTENYTPYVHMAVVAPLLALSLLFGGGQGWLGDTLCQLLALVAIGIGLWRHLQEPGSRWPAVALFALVPLAVPLLQLVPVADFFWNLPSARADIGADLAQAGVESTHRVTLVPLATERALWWLLPAVAMFLSVLQFDNTQRKRMIQIVVLIAAGSVVLGLAQLAAGPDSELRFYTITNPHEAVGFFANRNHFAILLAATLPLVIVGTAAWHRRRGHTSPTAMLGIVGGIGMIALLILGLAIARSRGGILLGMLGVLASLPIALKLRSNRRGSRRMLVAAIAIGTMLSMQFAMVGIMYRMEKDPFEDSRFRYADVAAQVASDHAPLGTGLGGFRHAYEGAETLPDRPSYVNHAHNEYMELWLETGWLMILPGLALAAGFVVAGVAAWRKLKSSKADDQSAIRAAAWLSLLLLILHSYADYPLRTTAMLAVAGLLAAIMTPPRNESRTPA